MECYKNIVGPQVRRLRYQRGLKQKELAAKLERLGWQIDRAGVSKIEARLMKVSDFQQLYLAHVLKVGLLDLFPKINAGESVQAALQRLMARKRRMTRPDLDGRRFQLQQLHPVPPAFRGADKGPQQKKRARVGLGSNDVNVCACRWLRKVD